jgi:PAS domain S-box-containing protein
VRPRFAWRPTRYPARTTGSVEPLVLHRAHRLRRRSAELRAYSLFLRDEAAAARGHAVQIAKRVENERRFAALGSRTRLRAFPAREPVPKRGDPVAPLEPALEELQSTVDELETTNEELQSTNEELEAINEELRGRTDEALRANVFLTSVLGSLRQSVIVVDPELRVTAWSAGARDLWGLRGDEVHGRHLPALDIGLPVDALREPIREVLTGGEAGDIRLVARNRRGQLVGCTTSIAPLRDHSAEVEGAILVTLVEVVPE